MDVGLPGERVLHGRCWNGVAALKELYHSAVHFLLMFLSKESSVVEDYHHKLVTRETMDGVKDCFKIQVISN